jgi:hypothetical protein
MDTIIEIDIEKFIKSIGGRKSVIKETGLTRGRISQWCVENHMPDPWLRYFSVKHPNEFESHNLNTLIKKAA